MLQFESNPIFQINYDALIFEPTILLDFGIFKNDPLANEKFTQRLNEDWQQWLPIFTDASKTMDESPVGSAVWIPKYKVLLSFKSPKETSVFSGEALAILEATLFVLTHNIKKSIIFTDSKSSLQALVSNCFKSKFISPLILKIKEALFKCSAKQLDVILVWIPGHCGISGNEQVDTWAKEAVSNGSLIRSVYACDTLPLATRDSAKQWQSRYDETSRTKGRLYKSVQPLIPPKPWFFNNKYRLYDKRVISTICRLRIGHTCTPVFLNKIHVRDSSICECGIDEGTTDHIFFNCPKYPTSLYDVLPPKIPRPLNFQYLMTLPVSQYLKYLCKYISIYDIKL